MSYQPLQSAVIPPSPLRLVDFGSISKRQSNTSKNPLPQDFFIRFSDTENSSIVIPKHNQHKYILSSMLWKTFIALGRGAAGEYRPGASARPAEGLPIPNAPYQSRSRLWSRQAGLRYPGD